MLKLYLLNVMNLLCIGTVFTTTHTEEFLLPHHESYSIETNNTDHFISTTISDLVKQMNGSVKWGTGYYNDTIERKPLNTYFSSLIAFIPEYPIYIMQFF